MDLEINPPCTEPQIRPLLPNLFVDSNQHDTMTNLSGLPSELLDGILEHLETKQLHAMAVCCKRLSVASYRYLYRKIDFVWDKESPESALSPRRFLCTILRHPQLALSVETISFQALNYSKIAHLPNRGYAEPEDKTVLSAQDTQHVHTLIEDLQLPDPDRWKDEFANASAVAPIALIISQIANVKSLTIDAEFQWDKWRHLSDHKPHLLGILLQHTVQAQPSIRINRFLHLKDVRLSMNVHSASCCQEWPVDPEQILPFLYAPCLESAAIKVDTQVYLKGPSRIYERPIQWPSEPPKAQHLHTLRLSYGRFTERTLLPLLSPLQNLKTFVLNFDRDSTAGPLHHGFDGFDGALIKQAIEPCTHSLEHLCITTGLFNGHDAWLGIIDGTRDWIHRPIGSLKHFSSLKTVELCLPLLLGWDPKEAQELSDVLPNSLEEIRINDNMWYAFFDNYLWQDRPTIKWFRKFLKDWRETHPHLKRIKLDVNDMDDIWLEDKRIVFQSMCESAGLDCEIKKNCDDILHDPNDPWVDSDGEQHSAMYESDSE